MAARFDQHDNSKAREMKTVQTDDSPTKEVPADSLPEMAKAWDRSTPVSQRKTDASNLFTVAAKRLSQGLAPPAEIYHSQHREKVDWNEFPSWARPADPDLFDGCCHEG